MTAPRLRLAGRTGGSRFGVAVSLAAYLVASLGIPFPAPALPPKSHDQPFPCQDHPCGCQTAEQCWRQCCCFSPEERWAWARAHGVEPPAYAERPAPRGWRSPRLRDQEAGRHQCGGAGECAAGRACCGPTTDSARPAAKPGGGRWLPTLSALACQGLGAGWAGASGLSLPPPPAVTWHPFMVPLGRPPLTAVPATSQHVPPPVPPPRPQVA